MYKHPCSWYSGYYHNDEGTTMTGRLKRYKVTLEHPGMTDTSHYYSDITVSAGSEERAKEVAVKREGGGRAIFVSEVRR